MRSKRKVRERRQSTAEGESQARLVLMIDRRERLPVPSLFGVMQLPDMKQLLPL